MAKINIRPLNDRVVIRPLEAEAVTAGGIILPDNAREKQQRGTVIATGEGRLLKNGERSPISLDRGDVVIFNKYGGSEVTIDGVEHKIVAEKDVLAKVD